MTEAKAPNLTPEQQALLSGAAAVDGSIEPVITHDAEGNLIAQDEAQTGTDAMQRNRELLNLGLSLLLPVAPFLKDCYPPATVDAIAGAFTAVEVKRGWDVQKFMSEEFVLAVVTIPPTIKAWLMGRAYLEQMRQQAQIDHKPNPDTIKTPDYGNL
jgi:hypothetical protein